MKYRLGDIVIGLYDTAEIVIIERCKDFYKGKYLSGYYDGITFTMWFPHNYTKVGNILDRKRGVR